MKMEKEITNLFQEQEMIDKCIDRVVYDGHFAYRKDGKCYCYADGIRDIWPAVDWKDDPVRAHVYRNIVMQSYAIVSEVLAVSEDEIQKASIEYENGLDYYEQVSQFPQVGFKAGAEWLLGIIREKCHACND